MAKKFEYKMCKRDDVAGSHGRMSEELIQLGQEGWELVGISPIQSGNNEFIFKREVESPITHKQEKNGYDISR